jgi:hypothetical protein
VGTDTADAVQLVVTPSPGPSTGMLGNNDGDPTNEFATRSGTQLSDEADADFGAFYAPGGYVDSWRITAEESLFHYEAGETTDGFVIEGFPAEPSDLDLLAFEDVVAAQEICETVGVERNDAFEDCVYDVAVTGVPAFAYVAFLAEHSTPDDPVETAGDEPPPDIVRPSVEGGSIVAFGDLVIEFGADPPIVDLSGVRPSWQCTVDDDSFFATSSFSETPTRMLEVAIEYLGPARNTTGEKRLSVIVRLNREDYAWALSFDDRFAGMNMSLADGTLTASGNGFLNDPLDTRLHPIVRLPDDAELSQFALVANCES